MYEVHKFGGASIGSLDRIKKTIDIIKSFRSDSKIIIFSAMGKVTNILEEIIIRSYKGEIFFNQFEKLKNYNFVKKGFSVRSSQIRWSINRFF